MQTFLHHLTKPPDDADKQNSSAVRRQNVSFLLFHNTKEKRFFVFCTEENKQTNSIKR